jgi:flagellar hook assembly protein FlgD
VNLSLSRAGRVKVAAYDLTGRLVRVLVDGEMSAGARMLTWDGRDEAGARLAPGAYVLRLEAGEIVQSRQVRVVR